MTAVSTQAIGLRPGAPVRISDDLQPVRIALSTLHQIDFKKLRYFASVAELGSFTKAAEQLHIAQPALSRQVRLLEEDLGLQLLARTGRGVTLTDAGQVLLHHTHGLAATMGRIREDMQARAGSPKGQVTIGIQPSCALSIIPSLVERVQRDFPMISLRIAEGLSLVLANWVELGTVDLAVLSYPVESRALRMEPIAIEDIVIVESSSRPGIPPIYSLSSLRAKPLMLSKTFENIARSALSLPSLELNVLLEIDAVHAIHRMVLQGVGAAMLPVSLFRDEIDSGQVTGSAITAQGVRRTLTLARPVLRHGSQAIEAVADALKSEVSRLEQEGLFAL